MMSDPDVNNTQVDKGPNPYDSRDHQTSPAIAGDAKVGIASLLGHLAGSLSEIDKQNVGGSSSLKAKKIDPKQAYQQLVGEPVAPPVSPSVMQQQPVGHPPPVNTVTTSPMSPVQPTVVDESMTRRVERLEKIVETYKMPLKFKRGISYTINTSKIKGTFTDPIQIIELLTSELSKQTKSITLKLNDNTKTKQ